MSVPAAVELAAQLAARDHVGIVGYRITRTGQISAGPYHRKDDVTLAAIFENDRLIAVRVLSDAVNGRDASAPDRQALEKQLLDGSKKNSFAVPFDARHFDEYRYRVQGGHVEFVTALRDTQHGDGFFDVSAAGAVVTLQYVPKVFPQYVTGGTVREERAQVLPNFWATVRAAQNYDGKYLFFHGRGAFVTVNSDFHRFASADAARVWLQAER
jgi:hypothetical protein